MRFYIVLMYICIYTTVFILHLHAAWLLEKGCKTVGRVVVFGSNSDATMTMIGQSFCSVPLIRTAEFKAASCLWTFAAVMQQPLNPKPLNPQSTKP